MLNPNPYTGAFGNDGAKYAEDVADVIRTCTPGGVAGFIAETIQGVGGTVPLADGYLPTVYEVRVPVSSHLSSSVSSIFGEGGPASCMSTPQEQFRCVQPCCVQDSFLQSLYPQLDAERHGAL